MREVCTHTQTHHVPWISSAHIIFIIIIYICVWSIHSANVNRKTTAAAPNDRWTAIRRAAAPRQSHRVFCPFLAAAAAAAFDQEPVQERTQNTRIITLYTYMILFSVRLSIVYVDQLINYVIERKKKNPFQYILQYFSSTKSERDAVYFEFADPEVVSPSWNAISQ